MSATDNFPFYLALVPPGTAFNSSTMARADFQILSFKISHAEGDIPSLDIEIRNPRQGILNLVGADTWGWFSWQRTDTSVIEALFFGRLVAIPTDMIAEVVRLKFSAQPADFLVQKQALATTLQVLPYYDDAFVEEPRRLDPDTVLEGYSALWHVDRITNVVTTSHLLVGEDGTFEFGSDIVDYYSVKMGIERPPLKNVFVDARIRWLQQDVGTIDMGSQAIKSYSDALLNNWPKPLTSIGPGWTVQYASATDAWYARHATTYTTTSSYKNQEKTHAYGDTMSVEISVTAPFFFGPNEAISNTYTTWSIPAIVDQDPDGFNQPTASAGSKTMTLVGWLTQTAMVLRYEAARDRTENIRFTLAADVQPAFSDPGGVAANFAQDSYLLDIQGSVGLEGPYGTYRGDWDAGTAYVLYDYFTVNEGGDIFAFQVTRDHTSLSSFDSQATANVWAPGAMLGAGENVYFGGLYYTVNVSHIAGVGVAGANGPPPLGFDRDGNLLFSLLVDPHSGPRLYQDLPGFKGNWSAGYVYVPNDIFIAPDDGTYYKVVIGHAADVSFNRYATDVTGRLLLSRMLNPAPIGDLSRRSYFPTDRGHHSFRYLVLRARAQLVLRSRAVKIEFDTPFIYGTGLSCRVAAQVDDPRIPGGLALGKVVAYELSGSGDGSGPIAKVTIGCAIGNGNSVTPLSGSAVYVSAGYVGDGYQFFSGDLVLVGAGDVAISSLEDAPIDDGLVFPLDKGQAVVGESFQTADVNTTRAIERAQVTIDNRFTPPVSLTGNIPPPDALAQQQAQQYLTAIGSTPSWYKLTLKPVVNGPFDAKYDATVSELVIPKQIDLSAPSS